MIWKYCRKCEHYFYDPTTSTDRCKANSRDNGKYMACNIVNSQQCLKKEEE